MAQPSSTSQTPQSGSGIQSSAQQLSFLTQGAAYDQDRIYAHSTDGKGHYERIRVKLTPSMEAELARLVASQALPYRTIEDVIRDALVHRLHYHMTTVRISNPVITAEMRSSMMNEVRAKIHSWQLTIEEAKETGESLLAAGALEELNNFLIVWDQDFENQDLPIVKQKELQEILDNLQDRLKRARIRDY